jgi:multidrug resistance protein, MATE family
MHKAAERAMTELISKYWKGPGGAGEVMNLAFPLMLSSSITTIQMFINRVFLAHYDINTVSAAMQGGISNFAVMAFFLGITGYVNTFVAQYTGANRPHRVGVSVWQGIYLALGSGLLIMLLIIPARWGFGVIGHSARLQAYEVTFFQIMCVASLPGLVGSALSCFYTGRGKTWQVLCVDTASCLLNLVLDYILIFGHFGFPQMGLAGAGWATTIAQTLRAVIYFVMFISPANNVDYLTRHSWKPQLDLLKRMIRYGAPNGIQFALDVGAFSLFLAIVGRMGEQDFAATSLVFQINHLAFMPMVGMGTAVTVLVGQRLGSDEPRIASRTTWVASAMCFAYMTSISVGYIVLPDAFLYPFSASTSAAEFLPLRHLCIVLLWFVAFYSVFDTGNIIFAATLKGAGDTRFVMVMSVALSIVLLVIPSILTVTLKWGLYTLWFFATAYVTVLAIAFLLRVIAGKWKHMRVIEKVPLSVVPGGIHIPTEEVDIT